ncbi:MAG: hypothetical protein P9X22_00440 [Candidatus Zapsychrus exili]|nr:hypothetical protein [Candidatus Zapsychrus exili]
MCCLFCKPWVWIKELSKKKIIKILFFITLLFIVWVIIKTKFSAMYYLYINNLYILIAATLSSIIAVFTFLYDGKNNTKKHRKVICGASLFLLSFFYVCFPFYLVSMKIPEMTGKEVFHLIDVCKVSCDALRNLTRLNYLPIGQPVDKYHITGNSSFFDATICYAKGDVYYALALQKYKEATTELSKKYPLGEETKNDKDYCEYFFYKASIELNSGFVYIRSNNQKEAIKALKDSINSTTKVANKYNSLSLKQKEYITSKNDKIKESFKGFSWAYFNLGLLCFDSVIQGIELPDDAKRANEESITGEDVLWQAVRYWGDKDDLPYYCLLYGYSKQLDDVKDENKATDIESKIKKLTIIAKEKLDKKTYECFLKKAEMVYPEIEDDSTLK